VCTLVVGDGGRYAFFPPANHANNVNHAHAHNDGLKSEVSAPNDSLDGSSGNVSNAGEGMPLTTVLIITISVK
jgi:hypothetical protein